MKTSVYNNLKAIVHQKCPNCGAGDVFKKRSIFSVGIPEMHEKCPDCGYFFEREPGYFLGAMYLSYGLGVFQGILAFLTASFLCSNLSPFALVGVVATTILVFAMWNFKLSRVIWLYIFPQ
ncbi:MAG: hypothetical protein K0S33_1828 [Bacteroidetes bacterium]|jgi:ribosomal protein S27AE|nr:hypothetical protein [Bacteroidota bacterium]